MMNLSTPPGMCQVSVRPDPADAPGTPHQAYCAGWDAARRGDDLANVIHDAVSLFGSMP